MRLKLKAQVSMPSFNDGFEVITTAEFSKILDVENPLQGNPLNVKSSIDSPLKIKLSNDNSHYAQIIPLDPKHKSFVECKVPCLNINVCRLSNDDDLFNHIIDICEYHYFDSNDLLEFKHNRDNNEMLFRRMYKHKLNIHHRVDRWVSKSSLRKLINKKLTPKAKFYCVIKLLIDDGWSLMSTIDYDTRTQPWTAVKHDNEGFQKMLDDAYKEVIHQIEEDMMLKEDK